MIVVPKTLSGWIILSLSAIAIALIIADVLHGAISQATKDILLVIVGGLVGTLTGKGMETPTNAQTSTTQTTTTEVKTTPAPPKQTEGS